MTDSHIGLGTILPKRKIAIAVVLLAALVMFLAWPVTTAQSPLWEVWVVNEAGQPLTGMTVALHYHNYSAESEGHTEEQQTDAKGYVLFLPRSLRVSRARRIVATLQSAGAGVHASFGPHAWVFAFGNGLQGSPVSNGYVTNWTGAPRRMSSRIVANPLSDGPLDY